MNPFIEFAGQDGPYDEQPGPGNEGLADEAAAAGPVPCVYFDEPGHTPDQKPTPDVYARDPDAWPLCAPCQVLAAEGRHD